jgi:glucose/arabinose dehydrogenase
MHPANRRRGRAPLLTVVVLPICLVVVAACAPAASQPSPATTQAQVRPVATSGLSPTTAPTRRPQSTPLEPDPAQVRLRLDSVATGLDRPVFATDAGDGSGRLFVVEKGGTIRILDGGRLLARPFLDIRDRVLSRGSEQGLLGLAFAPDFQRSGYFYVDYIDRSGNTVISRFQAGKSANSADSGSEIKVLGIDQPASNHNGGMLAFGPDGYLYVGTGDGGREGDPFHNGQNPQTLLGKLLRLDVTTDPTKPYTIPPSNPWVTAKYNGQAVLPEIWAIGLRNPWRFSFDRKTGDLCIGDVGQNTYEEIDRIAAGAGGRVQGGLNFGWSIMEGMHCYPDTATCSRAGLTLPVAEYTHGADGCSITGGYVYRGTAIPGLVGAYIYGDYCSGRIWALTPVAGGAWQSQLLLDSGLAISSFGQDQAGELYVVDLGGAVYRLAVN